MTSCLDFIYDASGRPYALYYTCDGSSTVYYYLLNLQGDVVRLVDATGATVANYKYDPYGKLLSVTDANGIAITGATHIANLNPLRYRGYYYDTETGWYYLQSRYYDPILKRFLNADTYASTGQGFLGYNMFAYCNNNPLTCNDSEGGYCTYNTLMTDGGGGLPYPSETDYDNDTDLSDNAVARVTQQHCTGTPRTCKVTKSASQRAYTNAFAKGTGTLGRGAAVLTLAAKESALESALGYVSLALAALDDGYKIYCALIGREDIPNGNYDVYEIVCKGWYLEVGLCTRAAVYYTTVITVFKSVDNENVFVYGVSTDYYRQYSGR